MVVTDAPFVPGRAARGLHPPGQAGLGERAEDVVHRLGGDRIEAPTDPVGDLVHFQVTALFEDFEYGQPRPGHA